jgi:hypothetical protein
MNYNDDHSDLTLKMKLSKIGQPGSAELVPGPNCLDAQAGDILAYFPDGFWRVFAQVVGMLFIPISFILRYVEWPPSRGSNFGPVDVHFVEPADTEWVVIDASGLKKCIRTSNGNRIEETIFATFLVEGEPVTFGFKSTALKVVRSFQAAADRVRVQIDGELVRVVGAQYLLSSTPERKGPYTWHLPTFKRIGVYGEPNGPSLELVRKAKALRFEARIEEDRQRLAALPAPPAPPPQLIAPGQPPRGSQTVTTGRWSDPKPTEQSEAKPIDTLPL